eukprot:gene7099-7851_t
MGCAQSIKSVAKVSDETREIETFGKVVRISGRSTIPMDVMVAHFTPSTFPLVPQLKQGFLPLCRQSWQIIVNQREQHEEYGTQLHGITAFYNEFYERLSKVDVNGAYEKILMKHAVGTNKIAAKGAIIVRIVEFLLKCDGDTPGMKMRLKMLGQSHKKYKVRPWQFAVFLELFLLTMGSRLKNHATPSVMEAWVNLLAYSLKHMLPDALDGTVLESEAHVNFVVGGEPLDIYAGVGAESRSASGALTQYDEHGVSMQSLGEKSHDTRMVNHT